MAGEVSDPRAQLHDPHWRDVDALLSTTATAAKTEATASAFYGVLIECARHATGGAAAGAWSFGEDGGATLICGSEPFASGDRRGIALLDERFIRSLARQRTPGMMEARERNNPPDQALLYGPVLDDVGHPLAIVLVTLDEPSASQASGAAVDLMAAFCELAADFHRRDALKSLQLQRRSQQGLEDFAVLVHRAPDVEAAAYAIANEGRRLIGCDRVSVITMQRHQPHARAVSGVDVLERRGTTLRTLESLAQGVARTGESVHLHNDEKAGEGVLDEVAEAYRDASLARRLDAWPLHWPPREGERAPRVMAVLVLEWFQAGTETIAADKATIATVRRLAETSLASALTMESIPWATSWRRLSDWLALRTEGRGARVIAGLLVVAAVVFLGLLIPAELTVPARGRLQPVERRAIFAPSDGVITDVLVDHGDRVAAGQSLLNMENATLAVDAARLTGELATAEQQLRSVRAERWSATQNRAQPGQDASELAAQEESLLALVASLTAQRQIAVEQERDLQVTSPIAGSVITWRAAELLRARPVARGQELLTVADENGPWMLELDVPDRQVRQILTEQAANETPLEVAFRLSTDPATTHEGRLRKVMGATQAMDGAQLAVPVEVDFEAGQVSNLRPGVEVTARVHCGRRPIAYVWLHEIWEWLSARIW
jgi:multidrug efflux pump subunit AcrA (membrane-fusion protein)